MMERLHAAVKLLDEIFFVPIEKRNIYINIKKAELMRLIMKEYPAKRYEAVVFDIETNTPELYEGIDRAFKCLDGRYLYEGFKVSRDFLIHTFRDLPCSIHLTVYVEEENLENAD